MKTGGTREDRNGRARGVGNKGKGGRKQMALGKSGNEAAEGGAGDSEQSRVKAGALSWEKG